MVEANNSKLAREILQVLRNHYQGEDFEEQIAQLTKLVDLTESVEIPSGVVAKMLKLASEEMRPLVAVYAAFKIGVAYERNQNAARA